MSSDLTTGSVVLITGAASGLGFELARAYLKTGHQVVMVDRDRDALLKSTRSLEDVSPSLILPVTCDISSAEEMQSLAKQTFDTFGRLDYLYNNAGISGKMAKFWELDLDEFQSMIDINLKGIIHSIHAFLPYLLNQSKPAHIVNISSCFGLVSASNVSAYSMTKSAIISLSESLYFEFADAGHPIQVSVVCPSFVKTNLLARSKPDESNRLHQLMMELIERSRPAEDIASHIIKEVENNIFYILPDREIKDYVEKKYQAIINQSQPHVHSLEKLMCHLSKRTNRKV